MGQNILMITTELYPFVQTGGLGDAVRSLSSAIREEGNDVRIFMPHYSGFISEFHGRGQALKKPLEIPVGDSIESARVIRYESDDGLIVYLLESEKYYGGSGIYGVYNNPTTRQAARKFVLLCRGACTR